MKCYGLVLPHQNNINATVGTTVSLPCKADEEKPVSILEWSRTDLRDKYVLVYKDEQFNPSSQHLSYKNRVDLQDRQMKDGNVSLVLKNVTTNDNGTYKCGVQYEGSLDITPINSIHLYVRLQGESVCVSASQLSAASWLLMTENQIRSQLIHLSLQETRTQ
uniref:Ig-like domain-containing protein n=1 Tax=Cyprinodon variegatus TaxID=28743 RepID=A0A3Q2CXG1_CYPVA